MEMASLVDIPTPKTRGFSSKYSQANRAAGVVLR